MTWYRVWSSSRGVDTEQVVDASSPETAPHGWARAEMRIRELPAAWYETVLVRRYNATDSTVHTVAVTVENKVITTELMCTE